MSSLLWLIGLPVGGGVVILFLRRWPIICAPLAGATLITSAVAALRMDLPPSLELMGQTLALAPAAIQSLAYAYVLVGVACIASCRRHQDGLLSGLVLASAALTATALAAKSEEILAFAAGGALLSLALAAPFTDSAPRLQSMRAISVLAFLPLLLLVPFWVLEAQQVPPIDEAALQIASVIAVVAGGLLLGLFPLHLWRSALHTTGHPAVVMSVATLGSLLGLQYIVRLVQMPIWPRFWGLARPLLLYGGALTALVAGLMSAAHTPKREVLGYASLAYWGGTIVQMGEALPSTSPSAAIDLWLGAVALLAASCALWCLDEDSQQPIMRGPAAGPSVRLASRTALVISTYALSGLPLSASFPVRLAGALQVAGEDATIGLALLAGGIGVAWGALNMARLKHNKGSATHRKTLSHLMPCALAVFLSLLLCLAFLFPALLRALPAAWLPDFLALY